MKSIHRGQPQYLDLFLLTHADDLGPAPMLSRRRQRRVFAALLAFFLSLAIAGMIP